MCLQLTRLQSIPRIALRNITVYKVLDINPVAGIVTYTSPYMRFVYELDVEYKSKLIRERLTVDTGLHSFVECGDALQEARSYYANNVVLQATIPRGSLYYKGYFGGALSIASTKLIVHPIRIRSCSFKEGLTL